MCGIAGICLDDIGAPVDRALLDAMTASLAHRGPDGQGRYIAPHVGLGHRRLSIIDLAGGDQPIFNEDGTIAIVFNGEIYNYKELRSDLLSRGHRFKTQSDTEVIVHLYEEFGDACVEQMNGMFAFALWDSRRTRLFAARDRFGEKPFYYHHANGRLIFGSELKAVLKDLFVPREPDPAALDDYLAYGYVPAPKSIYRSVHKLPPAHTLVWEPGRITTKRYWAVRFEPPRHRSDEDYAAELRVLLDDAIRLRLRSDVPVGAFLSGGVDSNTIVALASLQLDQPMQTFSVGFGEADYNELSLARLTAGRFHTDHHELMIENTDVSILPELVAHVDEPFGDPSMLPTYYIAREASRFVKVCLSGDAGDEVFGGYPHYREALRYARADLLPLPLRRAVFGTAAALLPNHFGGKGLLRRLSGSRAARYQRQIGVFDLFERRALLRPEAGGAACRDAALFDEHFSHSGLDVLGLCQLVDQNTYLPDDILVKVDRASMRHGLESRIPFLDHRLVELVNSMPADMKIRGTTQKFVLKRMAEGIVPREILAGPKKGFGIPLKYWLRADLNSFARDLLLSPQSRSGRFLRPAAVKRLLDDHDRGGRDFSDRIWTLLVLEQWCRCFSV